MPPTTPIIDLIADNIKDNVDEVTIANSYNYSITAKRPSMSDIQTPWDDKEALVVQAEDEELETELGLQNWRQFFIITVLLRDSDTDTAPVDTKRNRVAADIWKQLSTDRNRGDLARDTNYHGATIFDPDAEGMGGVSIKISVDYATLEDDPYTKG